eukprot:2503587-Rhodomonas_salina.4
MEKIRRDSAPDTPLVSRIVFTNHWTSAPPPSTVPSICAGAMWRKRSTPAPSRDAMTVLPGQTSASHCGFLRRNEKWIGRCGSSVAASVATMLPVVRFQRANCATTASWP